MRLALKTTAIAIPSMLLALLLGRLVAIEIYASKFPSSPIIKELRANPLRVLSVDWLLGSF